MANAVLIRGIEGAKFPLGQLCWTPGINELVATGQLNPLPYLVRHATGDWGDLDAEDKRENNLSVEHGYRIMSAYNTPAGKIWIVTEADRSVTTFLLPDEY